MKTKLTEKEIKALKAVREKIVKDKQIIKK